MILCFLSFSFIQNVHNLRHLFKQQQRLSNGFLKTNIVEKIDVKYQFKEKRSSTTRALGEIYPIYEWVKGPDQYTSGTEKVRIVVKKKRIRKGKKVDYQVDRDVDSGDVFSFGIARLFRKNRKKNPIGRNFMFLRITMKLNTRKNKSQSQYEVVLKKPSKDIGNK